MLSQAEANELIAMPKAFEKRRTIKITPGLDETHTLMGDDSAERFLLDIWRGTLRLSKLKFQTRGRQVIVLLRVDIDGAPHTNPDGERIEGTHVHRYREGFEDKWAEPLDPMEFTDVSDIETVFRDFCRTCNIGDNYLFQRGLI